jgi:molybdenum storage protein
MSSSSQLAVERGRLHVEGKTASGVPSLNRLNSAVSSQIGRSTLRLSAHVRQITRSKLRHRCRCRRVRLSAAWAGGTRSRHAYSIGLELGPQTGIIAAIGSSTSLQNAHMMQMLMAKHGGILVNFEEVEKLPMYIRNGGIPILVGMPPFHQ